MNLQRGKAWHGTDTYPEETTRQTAHRMACFNWLKIPQSASASYNLEDSVHWFFHCPGAPSLRRQSARVNKTGFDNITNGAQGLLLELPKSSQVYAFCGGLLRPSQSPVCFISHAAAGRLPMLSAQPYKSSHVAQSHHDGFVFHCLHILPSVPAHTLWLRDL